MLRPDAYEGIDSRVAVNALRLTDPTGIQTKTLPKEQIQLCGVFLYVTHVVQKQLRVTNLTP